MRLRNVQVLGNSASLYRLLYSKHDARRVQVPQTIDRITKYDAVKVALFYAFHIIRIYAAELANHHAAPHYVNFCSPSKIRG